MLPTLEFLAEKSFSRSNSNTLLDGRVCCVRCRAECSATKGRWREHL